MEELNDIIKNKSKNKNSSLYNKYDPLKKSEILLNILDSELENYEKENTTWNKLMPGYKKKYIIEYLSNNEIDEIDESTSNDIMRNIYNNQLNKHYVVDYDIENKRIKNINKL